ncbi:hypothetical protein Q1695_002752 [Nippostrongylus brasiliensis]|nr:hypothetical protein Q1695_002752 [Nippostrongylus brasiliensis]
MEVVNDSVVADAGSVMLTTEKRSKTSNSVAKRGGDAVRQHIGTYVPPVPPPLPHNYVDSVYSVRNPSLHTARSGSDETQRYAF